MFRLQDWTGPNQKVIKDMLAVRQRTRINPQSEWTVVHAKQGLYAAFVGPVLAIKLGSADWTPNAGLTKRIWKRSSAGRHWCVWERETS